MFNMVESMSVYKPKTKLSTFLLKFIPPAKPHKPKTLVLVKAIVVDLIEATISHSSRESSYALKRIVAFPSD